MISWTGLSKLGFIGVKIPASGEFDYSVGKNQDLGFVTIVPVSVSSSNPTARFGEVSPSKISISNSVPTSFMFPQKNTEISIFATAGDTFNLYYGGAQFITSQTQLSGSTSPIGAVTVSNTPLPTLPTGAAATFTDTKQLVPTSIAASTTETVETSGANTLATGTLVEYNLTCEGSGAIASTSGLFIYVALKGATSGTYYAVATIGTTISGEFHIPASEKINIVVRNSDGTDAHVMSAYWTSVK